MSNNIVTDPEQEVDPTGWSPTDVELHAERVVLGSMMIPLPTPGLNSPAITEIRRTLTPEHLFRPAHQAIMQAICDLEERGTTGIDPVIVSDELERQGSLGRVGGGTYLFQLMQLVSTPATATYHAEIVLGAHKRRAALRLATTVQQAAATRTDRDLDEIVDNAHQEYLSVQTHQASDLVSVGESSWLISSILETWGKQSPGSMTTGINDLDAVLDVDQGGLVTVGARSGVGKSILCAQIARHYAFERVEPSLFFSLEMTRTEMMERDLAAIARIRYSTVQGKQPLSEFERSKLQRAAAWYEGEGGMLLHDAADEVNLAHIRSRMAQVKRTYGTVGLVVVDHLGLATLPRADREDQAIGEFTRNLKQLAGEFECIIVLAAQLNRQPQNRSDGRPMASDIRGSDRVQQDSDAVMLMHDIAKYTGDPGNNPHAGTVDIILDKQRKGTSHTTITVDDRRSFARFGE